VTVYGRREDEARQVAGLVPGCVARVGHPGAGTFDVLVNATPVGMWPAVDASPVESAVLSQGGVVYDLVYNPGKTALLRQAEAAGCAVISGLEMLIAQAGRQFEWWTGTPAPRGVMQAAAVERLTEMAGHE
jgi:shikimate 5-dehydrogenase